MRTVGEVIVEWFLQSREVLCVVITFKEDNVSGIDLANLCNQAPVDGIHAVKIGPVIGTHVPWIVA